MAQGELRRGSTESNARAFEQSYLTPRGGLFQLGESVPTAFQIDLCCSSIESVIGCIGTGRVNSDANVSVSERYFISTSTRKRRQRSCLLRVGVEIKRGLLTSAQSGVDCYFFK